MVTLTLSFVGIYVIGHLNLIVFFEIITAIYL